MDVLKFDNSVPIKNWATYLEGAALQQAKNIARLPFIHKRGLALMPDAHAGVGSTVGTVLPTRSAIIPSAVGVDIGCGMVAVQTSLVANDLPESLSKLRSAIESSVPVGFNWHQPKSDRFKTSLDCWDYISNRFPSDIETSNIEKTIGQIGTLGSGNHFIELCLDENSNVWVMLHSGSRGIGNKIGTKYIDLAKDQMRKYHIDLPDVDLAYLPEYTPLFDSYISAMSWAQDYAKMNREVMLKAVLTEMSNILPKFTIVSEAINCHHNFTQKENHFGDDIWVTRKGAVRARKDELGIIPGSMGQRSFIVRGKGNADSYCSCSHGAGRMMSRTEAKRRFSITDLINQTEGVECRKDADVIDEIPSAYKDIDEVMLAQSDLVDIVHTLKAVLCVKG